MAVMETPANIVIFGASGDLTERKLIPALFCNFRKGRLPKAFQIIGYARTPFSDDMFRDHLRNGMQRYASEQFDSDAWELFAPHLRYFAGAYDQAEDYASLKQSLQDTTPASAGYIYYLATARRQKPARLFCDCPP